MKTKGERLGWKKYDKEKYEQRKHPKALFDTEERVRPEMGQDIQKKK